jgi:predicted transcriptional regulator
MKTYRNILKTKLMEKGLTQRQIASVMGWAGNSAVSLVLSGGRGISILWLAANSDDLVIADHKESVDIASISDQLSPEARQALLLLAKQMLNTM